MKGAVTRLARSFILFIMLCTRLPVYKRSLLSEKIGEGDVCTQDRYKSLFANELEKILVDDKITALSVNKYVPQALKQTLQKSIMHSEKLLG